MKTREEAEEKSKDLFNWFMEVRKEFPNVQLNKNGNESEYQVFFIGNKTVGSDYELNCWKEVPILKSKILQYSPTHPLYANDFFLDLRLNFAGSNSSEDWLLPEDILKSKIKKAFTRASEDFLNNSI